MMLKQKRYNETWTNYNTRLNYNDLSRMKPQHIEGVRLMRDIEDLESQKYYNEIGNRQLRKLLFILLIIIILCIIAWKVLK